MDVVISFELQSSAELQVVAARARTSDMAFGDGPCLFVGSLGITKTTVVAIAIAIAIIDDYMLARLKMGAPDIDAVPMCDCD